MRLRNILGSFVFLLSLAILSGCGGTPSTTKPTDKMGGDKMGGDKMGGDKMGGDKMGGEKK